MVSINYHAESYGVAGKSQVPIAENSPIRVGAKQKRIDSWKTHKALLLVRHRRERAVSQPSERSMLASGVGRGTAMCL